ncbi:3-hydroxyacyl-CoA dehydrogenase NAD-binding domain-containing protein, partial [Streptomyces sp. 2A115]
MTSASAPPTVVGVIGGGRMGAGIAQSFAAAGSFVVVVEDDAAAADAALD